MCSCAFDKSSVFTLSLVKEQSLSESLVRLEKNCSHYIFVANRLPPLLLLLLFVANRLPPLLLLLLLLYFVALNWYNLRHRKEMK